MDRLVLGRSLRRTTRNSLLALVGVLGVYFMAPVGSGQSANQVALGLGITAVCVGLVTAVVLREFRRQARGEEPGLTGVQLIVIFEMVLVLFALGYFSLATHGTNQMEGIETRLDALYFTATTMATVGYGDIHPVGQLARGVATAQMAFNVVFVAAFVRLLTTGVRARVAAEDAERGAKNQPEA